MSRLRRFGKYIGTGLLAGGLVTLGSRNRYRRPLVLKHSYRELGPPPASMAYVSGRGRYRRRRRRVYRKRPSVATRSVVPARPGIFRRFASKLAYGIPAGLLGYYATKKGREYTARARKADLDSMLYEARSNIYEDIPSHVAHAPYEERLYEYGRYNNKFRPVKRELSAINTPPKMVGIKRPFRRSHRPLAYSIV